MFEVNQVKGVGPGAAGRPFIFNAPLADCAVGQIISDASGEQSNFSVVPDQNKAQSSLFNEETLMNRLTAQWVQKKDHMQTSRDDVRQMAKHMLVDTLTKEWICDDMETAHVRVYVIDHILPSLVLGLEKLLAEVNKRSLIGSDEVDANFNPINFLAQFLMRNNPKYSNFCEASAYVRGLRGVSEHLKLELFHMTDNKLASMRSVSHKRREERELEMTAIDSEMNRRRQLIEQQFYEWNSGSKVELSLIKNALRSFYDGVVQFTKPLDSSDDSMKAVYLADYMAYVLQFVGPSFMKSSFDQLVIHMSQCIKMYQKSIFMRHRDDLFIQLFRSCDSQVIEHLNRHHVLMLLDMFYMKVSTDHRSSLARPHCSKFVGVMELGEDSEEFIENDVGEYEQDKITVELDIVETNEEEEIVLQSADKVVGMADNQNLLDIDLHLKSIDIAEQQMTVSPSNSLEEAFEGERNDAIDEENQDEFIRNNDMTVSHQESSISDIKGSSSTDLEHVDMSLSDHGLFAFVLDDANISLSQFVQLLKLFLHITEDETIVKQLITYIREGYSDNSCKTGIVVNPTQQSKQKNEVMTKLSDLFMFLDNDASGYINFEFIECSMILFKTVTLSDAVNAAKFALKDKINFGDGRLNKAEFCNFVYEVITSSLASGETIDIFLQYLQDSFPKTQEEQERGEMRRLWLSSIISAAETCVYNMEPIYNAFFRAFYKDALQHGNGKIISASVALIEPNKDETNPGKTLLRFVASTADQADVVLGKVLYEDMKGISFACVNTGRPIHVPNVATHGNIHFWDDSKKPDDRKGSFVVVPLQEHHKHVFGIIGIDTVVGKNWICKETSNTIEQQPVFFTHHEIDFYQGVAEAFSKAYHAVQVRQSCLHVCQRAMSWLLHRCIHIEHIDAYMVQPPTQNLILHILSSTVDQYKIQIITKPAKFFRKDNIFRDYLFQCAEISEPVMAEAFEKYNYAIPLRTANGDTVNVLDVNIGDLTALPPVERQQLIRIVKLLQTAVLQITLDSPKHQNSMLPAEAIFEHLMLLKLRDQLMKFDEASYSELKQEAEKNFVIQIIVKAAAVLLFPESTTDEYDDWQYCVQLIAESHKTKLLKFEPWSSYGHYNFITKISLTDVHYEDILNCNCELACLIYDWVMTCVSLFGYDTSTNKTPASYAYRVEPDILANYCSHS